MNAPSSANAVPSEGEPEGDTLSGAVKSVLAVLRRRWRVLAAITALITAIVVVAVMMMTPKYDAQARVKIDPSRSAAMGQFGVDQPGSPDQSIIETEASIIQSRDIARDVALKLKLLNDPEFIGKNPPLPAGANEAQVEERLEAVAGALQGHVSTDRDRSTYIVRVGFRSVDPAKAAAIANAFAQQYIDASVNRRTGTAERQGSALEKRLAALRQQGTEADARVAQYRAATGAVGNGGQTLTDQQLGPIAGQVATAESEAAAARSRLAIARAQIASGGIDAVSAVLSSNVIGNLRAQRAKLVEQQGEISTRYGPRHPDTIKITQQIASIDEQIADEAKRIVGGLQSEASAASARAASLRADMVHLQGQRAVDTRSSAMAETYQRQADAAQAAYNRLAEQAQATNQIAGSSLAQAQIVELATPPSAPTAPKKRMLIIAGFLFGLIAAMGVVTAQELMSSGLRTVADIRSLGLPLLASVPRVTGAQLHDKGGKDLLPADSLLTRPMGSYAEAYRVLRRSLQTAGEQVPCVIAIVSTLPDEGKTNSALSLARVMALAGERTLVIDTDLRRAGIKAAAGIESEVGLIEVLRDGVPVERAIQPDSVPQLDILPVASSSFTPEDLFSGPAMRDLLSGLASRYDRIVLDTPPLLGVADARTVALLSDAVVMIIRWTATPRNAVRTALSWLQRDGAPLVGAVLSMVDSSAEAYGALYYSRKYAQYYTPE